MAGRFDLKLKNGPGVFNRLDYSRVGGRGGKREGLARAASGVMVATASSQQQNSILHAVPEVLARDSRARRFGIDCPSELRWHAKEPGGDYKQKLLLKNISKLDFTHNN